ncbi:MAG: hypothetical protein LBR88_07465 [Zoogloeaceae bacterium]|nr:hypothetical protein [Zoogloeaceae bacterium]
MREIFDHAYTLIEPFFAFFEWGGKHLKDLALQRLNETYPKLSQENLHILIIAAERVYRERNGGGHAFAM